MDCTQGNWKKQTNKKPLTKKGMSAGEDDGLLLKHILFRTSLCSESYHRRNWNVTYCMRKTLKVAITYFHLSPDLTKFMTSTETDVHTCCIAD